MDDRRKRERERLHTHRHTQTQTQTHRHTDTDTDTDTQTHRLRSHEEVAEVVVLDPGACAIGKADNVVIKHALGQQHICFRALLRGSLSMALRRAQQKRLLGKRLVPIHCKVASLKHSLAHPLLQRKEQHATKRCNTQGACIALTCEWRRLALSLSLLRSPRFTTAVNAAAQTSSPRRVWRAHMRSVAKNRSWTMPHRSIP